MAKKNLLKVFQSNILITRITGTMHESRSGYTNKPIHNIGFVTTDTLNHFRIKFWLTYDYSLNTLSKRKIQLAIQSTVWNELSMHSLAAQLYLFWRDFYQTFSIWWLTISSDRFIRFHEFQITAIERISSDFHNTNSRNPISSKRIDFALQQWFFLEELPSTSHWQT